MAEESYKDYLAARVLTENRPVTYRLLSRALKIHVNIAKQMLYEFHTKQNAKKPNAVHATYLLTGRKKAPEHTNGVNGREGDDAVMHSSPFMSSLPEPKEPAEKPVSKTSIVLVREEELDKTKGEFEEITSIHIYSLEPGPLENLNMLSVCNQEATEHASEDPLERWRVYGSIHNPYIKRRSTKYTPAAPKAAAQPTAKPTTAAVPTKKEGDAAPNQDPNASDKNKSGRSTSQPGPAVPSLKRSDSKSSLNKGKSAGNLFKSFAKAKPKAKEAERSTESTPAPLEDEQMQGMSEDEGDAGDTPEVKFDNEKALAARKAKEDREDSLQKMMEADVEMSDALPEEEKDSQDAPLDKEAEPLESEAAVTTQGGRRRGRRRVMKKKRVKDEDGYLVTKEEMVWESFSEDEPEPKRLRPAPKPATSTAKGKKVGGKGQKNIANFFKKA